MSDLADRYLAAVARELPTAQRADIVSELRDEVMSRIEAEEAERDRPLSVAELEALLRDVGHPAVVAGRYRTVQHLIGPDIFPFWQRALKVTLTVIGAVYVVLFGVSLLAGNGLRIPGPLDPVLVLIVGFGVVTLVFAGLERYGRPERLSQGWRPARLPPAEGKLKSPFEIMVEMGMAAVALAWWTGLVVFDNTWPRTGLSVDLAPVWREWFWPIAAYLVGELLVNAHALLRPARVRLNAGLAVVRNLAGVTILGFVLQAERFVEVTSTRLSPDTLAVVQANFDRGFRIGIICALVIFGISMAIEVQRFGRGSVRAGSPARAA